MDPGLLLFGAWCVLLVALLPAICAEDAMRSRKPARRRVRKPMPRERMAWLVA